MPKFKIILLSFFLLSLSSYSQDNKLSNSALYKKAKELAYNKQRKEGRKACRILLERDSNNLKALVLIARTYLWDKNFEKCEKYVQKTFKVNKKNRAIFEIWYKTKVWNKKHKEALTVIDSALVFHPTDEDFLFYKAKQLVKLEREKEAIVVLRQLLNINPSNEQAKNLLKDLKAQFAENRIGANYLYNYYSVQPTNPLNGIAIEYRRGTKYGSIFLRNNFFNRFGKWGHQIEIDAYPRLFKGAYAYANFGYSYTSLFPVYRGGFEPFFKLPKSFEASIGFRYLRFSASDVTLFTGSIGKYFKSYWINLRTFITPKELSFSRSASVEIRRFTKDANNFQFIRIGYGASPDNPNNNLDFQQLVFVDSYKLGIGFHKTIKNWLLRTTLSSQYQILETENNLQISLSTGFAYAF